MRPEPTDDAEFTDSAVSVCDISPQTYLLRVDELVELHLGAMAYGPASRAPRRILWAANATRPGFTAAVAMSHRATAPADPADAHQRIIGIAYGFPGVPSSWWYREVLRGLRATGLSRTVATGILADFDELSEVHVMPGHQGHGIGRRLLDNLLPRLDRPMVMLSTPEVPDEANAAWTLYRELGFRDVLRDFRFGSDPRPFGILARPRP
ncbi:N-acetyltransferase [uncultured Corynebacterium sp.]|uniref:GNAT family N-acetyltransferase n=1 Tax=uncultured Corynebacterium sp. TaxID=159447 RepID=UPI0025EF99F7|nr:GNAT family N-acetyltransferase [uncultured Corynebacterium sp.]